MCVYFARTAPVALVNNDQVEEIAQNCLLKTPIYIAEWLGMVQLLW